MTVLIVDIRRTPAGFARGVLEADGYRIRLRGACKGVSQCAKRVTLEA
jgi:hypothetical protein